MSNRPEKPRKEAVYPNREKILELRDKYMRDMDAPSYSAVKEKFIQEIQSKRAAGESRQKEWGIGVWNNAFASSGVMQRSSVVLLAEFFGVEPEELILPSEPQTGTAPLETSTPIDSSPPATQSITVNGQYNQVAAASRDLVINGSIAQTVSPTQPEAVSWIK